MITKRKLHVLIAHKDKALNEDPIRALVLLYKFGTHFDYTLPKPLPFRNSNFTSSKAYDNLFEPFPFNFAR